ncbi:MAG: peptidoglycan endopeptidase [Neobacillus sp.]|nr:peptidoglycan endopeptidase [Neobacillus sp.]
MKKTIVRAVSTAAFLSTVYAGTAFASEYTVKKGDTLSKIALDHQTSVSKIKTLNNLKSDMIYVNQKLKLSEEAAATQPVVTAPTPTISVSLYTVKSGDYLGRIAAEFDLTVKELRNLNGLTSDLIYPGQKLKVSSAVVTTPPVVTPPVTVTPPPAVTPTKPSVPTTTTSTYTVKSGDYLGKIASQYKVTVNDLKTLNGLKSDMIYVGQQLKVAVAAGSPPTEEVAAPVTDVITSLVATAKDLMGIPYVWGGSNVKGFDCSGFIYYVANKSGLKEVIRTNAEGYYSRSYYVDKPQIGDLVFFENTYKKGISHVGFYIGNNQFIHADEKAGITITSLNNSYWAKHFDGIKRFY